MSDDTAFAEWAVLELMGHRRLAGHVTEQQIGGATFLRIDVPSQPPATQFYSPSSVYCITPCDETTARRVAGNTQPQPVQRWELPATPAGDGDGEPDEYYGP